MLHIESSINNINRTAWSEFVKAHPKGSIFQTPEMYDSYCNTPNHHPIILVATDNNEVVGVLLAIILSEGTGIKAFFSRRSIIFSGPIVKEDNEYILSSILNTYKKEIRGRAIYSQIRNQYSNLDRCDQYREAGFLYEPHLNFLIHTDSEEEIWNRIGKGRRKKIKKAINNKLSVSVFSGNTITQSMIRKGYEIIQEVYGRAKLPLVNIDLFSHMATTGTLAIFFVKNADNEIIGCRFALLYKAVIYGWYAGSKQQFYNLYPNDILIWETLRWSCQKGYKIFDYGGAGNPNKPYGVRLFKSQLGGELVDYGRYTSIHSPLLYKIGKIGMKLKKHIN